MSTGVVMEKKAGHTPGPWATMRSGDDFWIHQKTEDIDGGYFCKVECMNRNEEARSIAKANANLITAAPELLAALDSVCDTGRLLLDYMDGPRNPENQERNLADAIAAARAVIAKAKGGA